MVLAEAFGYLQTAEAIGGLITIAVRVTQYCKSLCDAPDVAKSLLNGIDGFDITLQTILNILDVRSSRETSRVLDEDAVRFATSVKLAAKRCTAVLENIEGQMSRFVDDHVGVIDRARFVSATPSFRQLLDNLAGHKQTLNISLLGLIIYDQAMQPRVSATTVDVQTLVINIGSPEVLQGTWQIEDNGTSVRHISQGPEPSRETADGPTTSMEYSQEVREGLRPMITIVSKKLWESLIPITEHECGVSAPKIPSAGPVPRNNREATTGMPPTADRKNSLQDVPTLGLDGLNKMIETYTKKGQKALQECRFIDAEPNITMAIAYLEQREKNHSLPFENKNEMYEDLAITYRQMQHWDQALETMEELTIDRSDCEGEVPPMENLPTLARQVYLLTSIYLERWMSDTSPDTKTTDWTKGNELAHTALLYWRHNAPLSSEQHSDFQCYLRLRSRAFHTKNMPNEASYFESLLDSPPPSLDPPAPTIANLRAAITSDNPASLMALLTNPNLDINATDPEGNTALHHAASTASPSTTTLLLRYGANINALNIDHHTPLSTAITASKCHTTHTLLTRRPHPPDLTTRHDRGGTLLHLAVRNKFPSCTTHLLTTTETLLNLTDRSGQTALHYAAGPWSNPAQLTLLLNHGADCNATDCAGRTPLWLALSDQYANYLTYRLLRKQGAGPGCVPLTKRMVERQEHFLKRMVERQEHFLNCMEPVVVEGNRKRRFTFPFSSRRSSAATVIRV